MKNDEFLGEVRKLAREETLQTALLIGAAKGEGTTEAFLAGIMENENRPAAFCVNSLTNQFICLEKALPRNGFISCYGVPICSADQSVRELEMAVAKIKRDHSLNGFDMMLIDGSKLGQLTLGAALKKELRTATHVVLDDINGPDNRANYDQLVRDPAFVMVDCDPGFRDGYAMFKKSNTFHTRHLVRPDPAWISDLPG